MATLSFSPAPIPRGQLPQWQASGRTLSHTLSPSGTEVGAFVTKAISTSDRPTETKGTFQNERAIFFGQTDAVAEHLVPLYTKTYTLFRSLQQIADEAENERRQSSRGASSKGNALPSPTAINFYSRIASLYVDTLRQQLSSPDFPEEDVETWEAVTQIFHLAKLLYAPEDGRGEGVVGEELLDWVNRADFGPTNEEGEEIFEARKPWEHEHFWSYTNQSLLRGYLPSATQLILTLASHPSPPLSRLAPRISSLLESYPRSSSASYSTERAFLTAHATWRSQFRTVARTLGGSGWSREGEWEEFDGEGVALEDRVKEMLDILEGNEAQILAESADWREAVGAWGLWVRPGLKRDDLPETIQHIVAQLPEETRPDESTAEDSVQLALLQGKITHAITLAYPFSIWLVTHLTDLLDKLSLLEPPLPEHPRSMRDHFVLEYADHLESDPGLWRLACDYLGTAGDEGKHRIAAIVERVELDKERDEESEEEAESGDAAEPELDLEKVDEVFQMLHAYELEDEARTLSRTIGEKMIQRRQYGFAVAYCIRAGDGRRLGLIAEKILNEYVREGPSEFIALVNSIPPSLFSPDSPHYIAGPSSSTQYQKLALANPSFAVLANKLSFLPAFRDFLEAYAADERQRAADLLVRMLVSGIAPVGFWAVLLVDAVPLLEDREMLISTDGAYELLRHLEEVVSASTHSPSDYLSHLSNLQSSSSAKKKQKRPTEALPNGTKVSGRRRGDETADAGGVSREEAYAAALKGLEVVRLALARYLAREILG